LADVGQDGTEHLISISSAPDAKVGLPASGTVQLASAAAVEQVVRGPLTPSRFSLPLAIALAYATIARRAQIPGYERTCAPVTTDKKISNRSIRKPKAITAMAVRTQARKVRSLAAWSV
jgi:hypothetical protein